LALASWVDMPVINSDAKAKGQTKLKQLMANRKKKAAPKVNDTAIAKLLALKKKSQAAQSLLLFLACVLSPNVGFF
jgi:hypothetical protein